MKGPTESKSPAYLKCLSRTSRISGTCPLPDVVVISPLHVGPSGSVPETMYMTSNGPQLLPSSGKDPLAHPPPPVEPYESFLLRTCRSQPVQGDSVPSVTQSIGALILSTSDGETGPVATSCPFPDIWCLPWDRPTYQGFVSSTWTQDAAPQASIHPSSVGLAVAWTWSRLITRDWSTGSASASTRTFSPYNVFPWYSGQAVHCSSSSVSGCFPGN